MHGLVPSARGVKKFYEKILRAVAERQSIRGRRCLGERLRGEVERVLFVQHGPNPDGGGMDLYHSFLRPLLFCLPAEAAHNLALVYEGTGRGADAQALRERFGLEAPAGSG
jgi:hypothetical protein